MLRLHGKTMNAIWTESLFNADSLSTKERLIRTAVQLFQQRGYYAVGTAEILKEAQIPRGSLYHHFPGGKADLAIAANHWLTQEVINALRNAQLANIKPVNLLDKIARGISHWLKTCQWSESSLLSVLTQETAGHEQALSESVAASYQQLLAAWVLYLTAFGYTPAKAKTIASAIISNFEGAMCQARALKNNKPLKTASTVLKLLLN